LFLLTLILFESSAGFASYRASGERERWAMMGLALMRGTLSAIGVLFGSLGMFFLYYSFMEPMLAAYSLMFLGTASAIAWSSPK
jgi:hypothetical protein